MKFKVIVFPGSNCDDDMVHVLTEVLDANVQKVWHKQSSIDDLKTSDCIILPGGFAYGDYLRSGALARFAPIMKTVISFARNGGTVFGICQRFSSIVRSWLASWYIIAKQKTKIFS